MAANIFNHFCCHFHKKVSQIIIEELKQTLAVLKLCNIHRKTPVLESISKNVSKQLLLKASNLQLY